MFVGLLRIHLHLFGNDSLKGKRKVVKSLIEKTRAKFNVSIGEVADNDNKRSAVIGAAVVGNNNSHVQSMLSNIASFAERVALSPVADIKSEIITIGDDFGALHEMDELESYLESEEDEW